MTAGGQNDKKHWRRDTHAFSFRNSVMKFDESFSRVPSQSWNRQKKKRVSGTLSGAASVVYRNEAYISGGAHGLQD